MTTKCLITIEEHSLQGGLGMVMNSFIVRNGFNHLQVINFGIPDTYVEQGSHKELILQLGLDAESIAARIMQEFASVNFYAHSAAGRP